MGDINQFQWVQQNQHLINGPVLEVGSRHYSKESSINYRALCKSVEYIGIDMSPGDNVDLVLNLTEDFSLIEEKLDGKRFNTVICCSVLEHVDNIFQMTQNISRLTNAGSVLFVSVPFTWRFHGYPNDYWRFTSEAIKYLFPEFSFKQELGTVSSNIEGDVEALEENPNSFIVKNNNPQLFKLDRVFKYLRIFTHAFKPYKYTLIPSMINMTGFKSFDN